MIDDKYSFVAYDGLGVADRAVKLKIVAQDDRAKDQFKKVWAKMFKALDGYHECNRSYAPGWVHWRLAEWYEDKKAADRQKFAAWVGSTLVGFLNLRDGYPSQFEPSKRVVYVEHIATAPGNLLQEIWGVRLSSIGTSLMAFAILQSLKQGHEGRIGLHAADDAAANYYRHLAERYGFLKPSKNGVAGTVEDKSASNRPYFESDSVASRNFLEDFRDE